MPIKTGVSGEAHLGVIIFRAKDHIREIAESNERPFLLADDEVLEIFHGVQVGVGGQVHLHKGALGPAGGGEVVILRQRGPHLRGADIERRHLLRF